MSEVDLPEEERLPSNDSRPNSGLREGDSSHADVNEAIALAGKTVIFGQQTRLRLGELTEDDKLPRYHAGHDVVKFFYGGVRQIPEHLLDAILHFGISVTMVQGNELLVYNHSRSHQSLHAGYTRKTIYMPEAVLKGAFDKGYDYWVISEVIIQESWPLMDYMAILELARRTQQHLRERSTKVGYYFIKDGLRDLAIHRRYSEETEDNEYMHLYRHYQDRLMSWDRWILDRDPYELADDVFDEPRERNWARVKIYDIRTTFGYPDLFDLDRDIVHPAAFETAEKHGQPTAPQSVDDAMHDLTDAARFRVSRQIKTDDLMVFLLNAGAPGIRSFIEGLALEKATGFEVICKDLHDGYDAIVEFKKLLQQHSDTPIEGVPGSISNDFNSLFGERTLHHLRTELDRFTQLPKKDQEESLGIMREMARRMVAATRSDLDAQTQEEAVATPADWTPARCVRHWYEMAEYLLEGIPEEMSASALVTILQKLDRHPRYHSLFRQQVDELTGKSGSWKEDIQSVVADLYDRMPTSPYRFSSDAAGISSRLRIFERMRRQAPDNPELLGLLAGMVVRLDQADDYEQLVSLIAPMAGRVTEALEETVEQISFRDQRRKLIRDVALKLLERGQPTSPAMPQEQLAEPLGSLSPDDEGDNRDPPNRQDSAADRIDTTVVDRLETILPAGEQMSERVLVMAFYHLVGARPSEVQLTEGVGIVRALCADGLDQEQIKTAIRWTVENVPEVTEFTAVKQSVTQALGSAE